ISAKDADGNVAAGDVLLHDVHDSYVHGTSRLVAAVGVRDVVLVVRADEAHHRDVNHSFANALDGQPIDPAQIAPYPAKTQLAKARLAVEAPGPEAPGPEAPDMGARDMEMAADDGEERLAA
ncbi:MAG: alternative oxidase, partial [Thermaurantiacus sp.]